jgi:hypothetical protein
MEIIEESSPRNMIIGGRQRNYSWIGGKTKTLPPL